MSHAPANILPLRPRDQEDAARVAISWLAERHRKGWRNAFEDLLDHWQPKRPARYVDGRAHQAGR